HHCTPPFPTRRSSDLIAKRPGMSESRPVRGVEEEADTKSGDEPKKKGDALDAYCINLNKKAREGKIDPLIGREAEISRTIQVLRSEEHTSELQSLAYL